MYSVADLKDSIELLLTINVRVNVILEVGDYKLLYSGKISYNTLE